MEEAKHGATNDDGWVDFVDLNGVRLVRLAEPGTRRNQANNPVNSILMSVSEAQEMLDQLGDRLGVPGDTIDMLIFCPNCGTQHIDRADLVIGWTNPPHKTHLCICCNWTWRVCDRPTNGVHALQTHGRADGSPVPRMLR